MRTVNQHDINIAGKKCVKRMRVRGKVQKRGSSVSQAF